MPLTPITAPTMFCRTTMEPAPPIAMDCKYEKRLPFATNGIVDCHHDAKLPPATPVEQNPAVQSAVGVNAAAVTPAVPAAAKRTAAHFGEILASV